MSMARIAALIVTKGGDEAWLVDILKTWQFD
jgi:hypothetical protein